MPRLVIFRNIGNMHSQSVSFMRFKMILGNGRPDLMLGLNQIARTNYFSENQQNGALMLSRIIVFFLALIAFSSGGLLHAQTAQPNGCGSNFSQYIVPDRLLGCEMKASCDAHDVCYGRCISAEQIANDQVCFYRTCETRGANAGKSVCSRMELQKMKQARDDRRLGCDEKFFDHIKENNSSKAVCRVIGKVYRKGVKVLGNSSFFGTTVAVERLSDQERAAYKTALNEFFLNANESEIIALELELERGGNGLDLSKPIRYDKGTKKLLNSNLDKPSK